MSPESLYRALSAVGKRVGSTPAEAPSFLGEVVGKTLGYPKALISWVERYTRKG